MRERTYQESGRGRHRGDGVRLSPEGEVSILETNSKVRLA